MLYAEAFPRSVMRYSDSEKARERVYLRVGWPLTVTAPTPR